MRALALALSLSSALLLTACGGGGGGGTTGGGGGGGGGGGTVPTGSMSAAEKALGMDALTAINNYRMTQGLGPLLWYTGAEGVAYSHCLDMEANGFFDHNSPTTGTPAQRVQAAGITNDVPGCLEPGTGLPCQGENLAMGFNSLLTGQEVTNGWIGSAGHHAQLIAGLPASPWPAWTHCTIGVRSLSVPGGTQVWWTAVFFRNPAP